MSSEPAVPTYILQGDGLFREGLRLILSSTRFRSHACAIKLDDLTGVPSDKPIIFIIGVAADQPVICNRIRPISVGPYRGDGRRRQFALPRQRTGRRSECGSVQAVSSNALISTLQAMTDSKLILIDSRLWSHQLPTSTEERPSFPLQNEMPQTETHWEHEEPHTVKQLSAREVAILERIVRGDSNKRVALFFNIAEPTVKAHVKAIFQKIGASNRTQVAIWALNKRLFEEPAL
jgi:two-component system nitrate/nitrite response regulator NarL